MCAFGTGTWDKISNKFRHIATILELCDNFRQSATVLDKKSDNFKIGPRVVLCQSFEIRCVRFWNQNYSLLLKIHDFTLTLSDAEASNIGGFTKTLWRDSHSEIAPTCHWIEHHSRPSRTYNKSKYLSVL